MGAGGAFFSAGRHLTGHSPLLRHIHLGHAARGSGNSVGAIVVPSWFGLLVDRSSSDFKLPVFIVDRISFFRDFIIGV